MPLDASPVFTVILMTLMMMVMTMLVMSNSVYFSATASASVAETSLGIDNTLASVSSVRTLSSRDKTPGPLYNARRHVSSSGVETTSLKRHAKPPVVPSSVQDTSLKGQAQILVSSPTVDGTSLKRQAQTLVSSSSVQDASSKYDANTQKKSSPPDVRKLKPSSSVHDTTLKRHTKTHIAASSPDVRTSSISSFQAVAASRTQQVPSLKTKSAAVTSLKRHAKRHVTSPHTTSSIPNAVSSDEDTVSVWEVTSTEELAPATGSNQDTHKTTPVHRETTNTTLPTKSLHRENPVTAQSPTTYRETAEKAVSMNRGTPNEFTRAFGVDKSSSGSPRDGNDENSLITKSPQETPEKTLPTKSHTEIHEKASSTKREISEKTKNPESQQEIPERIISTKRKTHEKSLYTESHRDNPGKAISTKRETQENTLSRTPKTNIKTTGGFQSDESNDPGSPRVGAAGDDDKCDCPSRGDNSVRSKSKALIACLVPFDERRLFTVHLVRPAIDVALKTLVSLNLLPRLKLEVRYRDTNCSISDAMNEAVNFYANDSADVYFGPTCDYAAAPVARQVRYWNKAMVTAGAMAGDFGLNKFHMFPLLTRAGANFNNLLVCLTAVLNNYRWNRLKLVYDPNGYTEIMDRYCHIAMEAVHHGLRLSRKNDPSFKQDHYKFYRVHHALEDLAVEIGDQYAGLELPGSSLFRKNDHCACTAVYYTLLYGEPYSDFE